MTGKLRPKKFVYCFLYQLGVLEHYLVKQRTLLHMYVTCGCSILRGEYESVMLLIFGGEYL